MRRSVGPFFNLAITFRLSVVRFGIVVNDYKRHVNSTRRNWRNIQREKRDFSLSFSRCYRDKKKKEKLHLSESLAIKRLICESDVSTSTCEEESARRARREYLQKEAVSDGNLFAPFVIANTQSKFALAAERLRVLGGVAIYPTVGNSTFNRLSLFFILPLSLSFSLTYSLSLIHLLSLFLSEGLKKTFSN